MSLEEGLADTEHSYAQDPEKRLIEEKEVAKEIIDKICDLVPLGGEETISFSDEAKYKQTVTGFVDREWFGNIEYNYKTYIIIPEVCLKEDVTDERVCKVT